MSESLTSEVFGRNKPGFYRVYHTIENSQELEPALAQPYPVVLMFRADWNEPSRVMRKPFRDMALAKRKQAIFCQLDVDKFKDIVERYRVEALPTFVLIKEGKETGRVVGAKVDELEMAINLIVDAATQQACARYSHPAAQPSSENDKSKNSAPARPPRRPRPRPRPQPSNLVSQILAKILKIMAENSVEDSSAADRAIHSSSRD